MTSPPAAESDPEAPSTGASRLDDMGNVGRSAGVMVASQFISWGFAAVTITIVPRYLGDVAVGQLAVASAVWMLASIAMHFGGKQLLTREMAVDVDRGNSIIARVLPLHVIALLVVLPVIAGYAYVSDFDRTEVAILAVMGVSTTAHTFSGTMQAALAGRGRISVGASLGIFSKATATLAVVLVVLFVDRSVLAIAASNVVGAALLLSMFLIVIRRDPEIRLGVSRRGYGDILKASSGFLLLSGVITLYREIDVVVIAALADSAAVGWYAQTDRLFGTMLMIPSSLAAVLYPTLSRRWSIDRDETFALVRRSATLMFVLIIPIAAGCIALGDELAILLFGPDFAPAGIVLKIYAVALIPVSYTILLGMMCLVMGRERVWSMVMLTLAALTIPLDLVLVPWAESTLDNAAAAGAIAFVITETLALTFGVRKVVPGIIPRSDLMQLAKASTAAAIMGFVAWSLRDEFIVIPIGTAMIIYPTLVFATGAFSIGELSRLGGPFGRLARFQRGSADSSVGTPGPAEAPEEGQGHEP